MRVWWVASATRALMIAFSHGGKVLKIIFASLAFRYMESHPPKPLLKLLHPLVVAL